MTRFFSLLGVLGAFAAALAAPAQARPWVPPPVIGPQFNERPAQNRSEVRPLHELLPGVRRELGGDFVGLVRLDEGGRPAYVIRWRFEDGRIGDVRVDAQSGDVLDR